MDEQKEKMQAIIEKQALKIKDMSEKYKEKHDLDVKRALLKYQNSLKHVNEKVYHVMEKQMPSNMRSVIIDAITGFKEGDISKHDVSTLIHKYFSDKLFQDILKCDQGQLDYCQKINFKSWRSDTEHAIGIEAHKAKRKLLAAEAKKKDEAIRRINAFTEQKTKKMAEVTKAENELSKRAEELTKKILKND